MFMLVRNLDFLSIPKEFSKVELNIYENKYIVLILIEKKGYALVLKDNEDIETIFLLKTNLMPQNINGNAKEKEDFINVLKMLLDKIYSSSNIKEYEKQHQEHVFLRLMDLFVESDNIEKISDENSDLYGEIENGLMKLELDIMENKINALNQAISEMNSSFTNTVNNMEENQFGNKIRKVFDQ